MNRNRIVIAVLGLVLWGFCARPPAYATDAADGITDDAIRRTITDLAAFGSRRATEPVMTDVSAYLAKRLDEVGLEASFDAYHAKDADMRNVVGRIAAKDGEGKRLIVIGAHYDSFAKPLDGPAPGADDNGSGVAAALAAAAALKGAALQSEVRVVFFNAEEIGFLGSKHYVNEALATETRPIEAIDVDYIGSGPADRDSTVILFDRRSAGLMKTIRRTADERVKDLSVGEMRSDVFRSFGDYKPFWDTKRPAVMFVREYQVSAEEAMHTKNDLPERVNVRQVAKISKLIYYSVLALDAGN